VILQKCRASPVAPPGTISAKGTPVWSYGFAHGGKTLFWTVSDLYFAFFMTEVCGLPPLHTGMVVGGSLLFAAVADLALVRLLTTSLAGRDPIRLQLVGALASAGALMLFAAIAFLPLPFRLAGAILTLLGFRATYALVDVPQNALLSLAAADDLERRRLTMSRNVAGGAARVLLAFAFVPIMARQAPAESASSFLSLVIALSVLMITGASLLTRSVGTRRQRAGSPIRDRRPLEGVWTLTAMMGVMTLATTVFGQLEPYLASYGMGGRLSATAFMGLVAVGGAVSQPGWLKASSRLKASALLGVSMAVMLAGSSALILLDRTSLPGALVIALLYGTGSGGVLFTLWSGIAGRASEGNALAVLGRFTAFAKTAQGIAVLLVGAALDTRIDRTDGQMVSSLMVVATVIGVIVVTGLLVIRRGQLFRT
jgi:Na+/melibiose symporter-like transporter